MFEDIVVSPCLLRDSLLKNIVILCKQFCRDCLKAEAEFVVAALRDSSTIGKTPVMVECDVSGPVKRTWRAVGLLDCLHVLP
jgi:hypothetical protein